MRGPIWPCIEHGTHASLVAVGLIELSPSFASLSVLGVSPAEPSDCAWSSSTSVPATWEATPSSWDEVQPVARSVRSARRAGYIQRKPTPLDASPTLPKPDRLTSWLQALHLCLVPFAFSLGNEVSHRRNLAEAKQAVSTMEFASRLGIRNHLAVPMQ